MRVEAEVIRKLPLPHSWFNLVRSRYLILEKLLFFILAAGIPDFRSPGTGLYDNLQKYDLPSPQSIFEIEYFKVGLEFSRLKCGFVVMTLFIVVVEITYLF